MTPALHRRPSWEVRRGGDGRLLPGRRAEQRSVPEASAGVGRVAHPERDRGREAGLPAAAVPPRPGLLGPAPCCMLL